MDDDHVAKTIAVYNQIANDYARKIDEYLPEPELRKFLSYLPPDASVLDPGCGPGRDCEYFFKHGLHVTGVDLSEKLLDLAKKRATRNFICLSQAGHRRGRYLRVDIIRVT